LTFPCSSVSTAFATSSASRASATLARAWLGVSETTVAVPEAVAIASLGDMVDVDVSDLLDFFALDRGTRAILLYIESITDARKFMSAARAAARTKPVVVVKSGRHAQGAKAAQTHTGALAGADAVYDAASRLPENGFKRPSVSAAANSSSRSSTRRRPARRNAL
jgi:hypothetical protein